MEVVGSLFFLLAILWFVFGWLTEVSDEHLRDPDMGRFFGTFGCVPGGAIILAVLGFILIFLSRL